MEGGGGAKGWGLGRTEIEGNVSNCSAEVAVGASATRELKDAPPTNASNGKPAIKSAAIRSESPGRTNRISFWVQARALFARFVDEVNHKNFERKSSDVATSSVLLLL